MRKGLSLKVFYCKSPGNQSKKNGSGSALTRAVVHPCSRNLADSLLTRSMDVNLGISFRKSLLCSMVEVEAAQEAQQLGPGLAMGNSHSYQRASGRRCVSIGETSLSQHPALGAYNSASNLEVRFSLSN